MQARLERQIEFLLELDKLKTVLRRSYLLHEDRRENSAEHSWHVAMAAVVLAEWADEPVDVGRAHSPKTAHNSCSRRRATGSTVLIGGASLTSQLSLLRRISWMCWGLTR